MSVAVKRFGSVCGAWFREDVPPDRFALHAAVTSDHERILVNLGERRNSFVPVVPIAAGYHADLAEALRVTPP